MLAEPKRRLGALRRLLRVLLRVLLLMVMISIVAVLLLRWLPPPTSSFMVQHRLGGSFGEGFGAAELDYDWVPYRQISPQVALAVVAAEDQRFLGHGGFDFYEIGKALEAGSEGGRLRGASTISQQVAKNLFLWPGRSLLRKGLEAWFTVLIEALWSKRRILEVYLNIAQMGDRTFGAEAASRRFFGKSALRLDRRESALLAAVLPNPIRYRVEAPSPYVRRRQAWILKQMRQLGGVSYLERL